MKKTKQRKRTILIGRGTIAVNCLEILYKKKQLPVIIICDPEDKGLDSWTKSLYKKAIALGYADGKNLFRERKVNNPNFISKIKEIEPKIDIIFSIQPKALFKKPFMAIAKDYVVNLHMAPLPKLRGVATGSWAILDGLKKMGVTIHIIQDEGIDNGPIVDQTKFLIKPDDTVWILFNKCIRLGTKLFNKNLLKILYKKITPIKQDESESTYHPIHELDYQDLEIKFTDPIRTSKFIRSKIFPPMQLPYFIYEKKKISVLNCKMKKTIKKNYKNGIVKKRSKFIITFPYYVMEITEYKETNTI